MKNKSIFCCYLIMLITTAAAQPKDISIVMINELHKRSLILLENYNLNPVNNTPFYNEPKSNFSFPVERSFVFDTTDSDLQKPSTHKKLFFHMLQDVSEKIGLNPSIYIGKRLVRLNYLLLDSSQANRSITAHILFADTKLAGAYLSIDGSYPGIVTLNDRSDFKPKNFTFPIFDPDSLDTVSIFGPWDKSENRCDWINRINSLSKEELTYIASTFSAGKKVKGDLNYTIRDPIEEYAVFIKLKTGEQFFPHFIFRNDTVYLNDYKCYYILDRKFMDFIKDLLKSKGVSTCQEHRKLKKSK